MASRVSWKNFAPGKTSSTYMKLAMELDPFELGLPLAAACGVDFDIQNSCGTIAELMASRKTI